MLALLTAPVADQSYLEKQQLSKTFPTSSVNSHLTFTISLLSASSACERVRGKKRLNECTAGYLSWVVGSALDKGKEMRLELETYMGWALS